MNPRQIRAGTDEPQERTRVLFHPLEQIGTGADEPKTEKQIRAAGQQKNRRGYDGFFRKLKC